MSFAALVIVLLLVLAFAISNARRWSRSTRSDAEEIAAAQREMAEHDRELAHLRELAPKDIASADALRRLLTDDLARTREALRVFKKRRADQLAGQFSEDEQALVAELGSLEATIMKLRLRSGAA